MRERVLLLMGAMLLVVGCQPKTATRTLPAETGFEKEDYTIGVAMTLGHPYWRNMERGVNDEAKAWEKSGGIRVAVRLTNCEEDARKQIDQIQGLIGQKVDACVVVPVQKDALVPGIKALNRAGIPVIILNREVAGGDCVCYTGVDTYKGAVGAAEILMEAISGKGEIAELHQILGTGPQILRTRALDEVAKRYPEVKIVARLPNEQDRSKTISRTQEVLTKYPNLKGIYAHGDIEAMAAVMACEQANRKDVKVIGMGGSAEAIKAIRDGRLTGSTYQQPYEEGRLGIKCALRHLKGEKLPKEILLPCPKITKENAAKFKGQY